MDDIQARATAWIIGHDTGVSSKTIWAVMIGGNPDRKNTSYWDIPSDPADFGRCYRLLKLIPEWKKDLNKVAKTFPKWKYFIDNWDKMEAMYLEELPTGRCPKLYEFMQEYIRKEYERQRTK